MYVTLLFLHSIFRWLVVISLVYAVYRAFRGLRSKAAYAPLDDKARHWANTLAQMQLTIGYILYFISPVVKYFRTHYSEASQDMQFTFFGIIHISIMTLAVILLSIGASMVKRKETDAEKFRTMAIWFTLVLVLIFIAIPWPFSPLAARPYYRLF